MVFCVARAWINIYNIVMAKKKSYENAARAAAKKAVKNNPKAVIFAVIAILLIIAIAFCVLYFGFPNTWDSIVAKITGNDIDNTQNIIIDPSLQLPEGKMEFADGELSIHMLDVGQGDCLLILFPDGKDMIIDCANYNNTKDIKTETLNYLDRYVTDRELDYMMLTHCDSDHVYFMDEVIDRYQIKNIYMPNVLAEPDSETWKAEVAKLDDELLARFTDPDTISSACYAEFFCAALTEPDCNVVLNVDDNENTNNIVIDGEGYSFTFYCPTKEYYRTTNLNNAEKKNAISPIGVLEYKEFRIVFTGDSNELNEPTFVRRIGGKLDCDLLKVGHHGSETSSTEEFLDAITCEYAIISCNAYGNKFDHPRQATLDRLIARKTAIYRTDNNGNIVFVFNTDIKVYVETRVTQETNQKGLTGTSKS